MHLLSKSFCFVFIFLIGTSSSIAQDRFFDRLADSAASLVKQKVTYDLSYYSIPYPNGDVPKDKGVCTDVIIRVYRKLHIDLQELVHEDMQRNFAVYPKEWGLRSTDKNIDHRRVPNLMTFFKRMGAGLQVTNNPSDYIPGDIVCWSLERGVKHIGMVVRQKAPDQTRHLIIHSIGSGQIIDDMLFRFRIIGHYRFKLVKP